MRCKPKTNRYLVTRVFPRLAPVTVYLLRVVIGSFCCLRLQWLVIVIALVLVLQRSIENYSNLLHFGFPIAEIGLSASTKTQNNDEIKPGVSFDRNEYYLCQCVKVLVGKRDLLKPSVQLELLLQLSPVEGLREKLTTTTEAVIPTNNNNNSTSKNYYSLPHGKRNVRYNRMGTGMSE